MFAVDDDSSIEGEQLKLGQDLKVDWFHFETRMRKIIQEILEPVIKTNDENSISLKINETDIEEIKERLSDQDFRTRRLEEGTKEFSNLDIKINGLRSECKVSEEQLKFDLSKFQDEVVQTNNLCAHNANL